MIYLLTVTLVWAAGLALYLGLLKKVPAYGFNRTFLLTTLLSGMLVPFIPVWSGGPEALPALMRTAVVQLPGVVITADGMPAIAAATSTPWWLILYGCGAAAAVGLLACSVYRLLQLYKKSSVVSSAGELTVRNTGRPIAPFSFAKTLFVSDWNGLSISEQEVLARHETAHYQHFHVLDNVLASIVVVLAWFHPLAYVIRKELRLVHEFQADAHTLSNIDARSYREVLLRQQLGAPNLSLVASFAQSPLKTRFSMMTSSFRQNQFWRLGFALLCMLLVVAACTKEEIDETEVADLIADQMEGDLLSAADAADIEGMTLTSTDTVVNYDPVTSMETVVVIGHYEDKATNRSKSIRRELTGSALSNYDRPPPPPPSNKATEMFRSQVVYKVVDQMPMFPGCDNSLGYTEELKNCSMKKMLEFIYTNIKYPASARAAGIEGTAVVNFIVGTDGEVLDQKVVRNPAEGKDAQAEIDIKEQLLKITADMPAWIPGKQQGKDVQVRFNLPVKFKLQ